MVWICHVLAKFLSVWERGSFRWEECGYMLSPNSSATLHVMIQGANKGDGSWRCEVQDWVRALCGGNLWWCRERNSPQVRNALSQVGHHPRQNRLNSCGCSEAWSGAHRAIVSSRYARNNITILGHWQLIQFSQCICYVTPKSFIFAVLQCFSDQSINSENNWTLNFKHTHCIWWTQNSMYKGEKLNTALQVKTNSHARIIAAPLPCQTIRMCNRSDALAPLLLCVDVNYTCALLPDSSLWLGLQTIAGTVALLNREQIQEWGCSQYGAWMTFSYRHRRSFNKNRRCNVP